MSIQPPAAPHRVSIADVEIPFWRLVFVMIKWMFAAIPAVIIFLIIFWLIWLAAVLLAIAPFIGNIPGLKM